MTDRYNPTSDELARWLRERAALMRAQFDRFNNVPQETLGVAEQLERCADALSHAHGPWVPAKMWTPVEDESVLLMLKFEYRNAPPLIHYDVGRWTQRGGGDWDRLRVGEVLAVSKLYEAING